MMPEATHKKKKKDVNEHLKEKAQQGAGNIIESLLKQDQIQRYLLKQSLETGLFVSFLIIGIFTLINVIKILCDVSWQADLSIALVFITVFIGYVISKLRK